MAFKTEREYAYYDLLSQEVEMAELMVERCMDDPTPFNHEVATDTCEEAREYFENEKSEVPEDLQHIFDKAYDRLVVALTRFEGMSAPKNVS